MKIKDGGELSKVSLAKKKEITLYVDLVYLDNL